MVVVPLSIVSVRFACWVDVVVRVVVLMGLLGLVVGGVAVVVRVVLESGGEGDELGTGIGCSGPAGEGIGSGVTKILQSVKALVSLAIACVNERML